jgi:uroporphyrinogen III methyltransferase/synthase
MEGMETLPSAAPAKVFLVGAGPGDPGLLTLRAVECLRRAEFILCDYLVNPAVLDHAPASAEVVRLGHHSTGRSWTPGEIVARMLDEALQGRTVVRLKGGDPSVFGRGADEVDALRDAGVPYEIVPGITTGLAVAAFCEIPITHHRDASAVALIAGQERRDKAVSALDYQALARFPGTLIFYMGVTSASQWSRALIAQGKPAETPVAVVWRCTWAGQRTIRCTLATVAEVVEREKLRPPAVFVVGKVVDHAPEQCWFGGRPSG